MGICLVRVFITDFIKSSKCNRQEICDKTESINEGREDFFFLTEVRDARIRGAALVLDEKNLYRRVEDYMRKIGVSADVSALNEVTAIL